MANLYRLRVSMSGAGLVGPGVVTFYAKTTTGFPSAVNALWTSQAANFPSSVTFTTPNGGDTLDESNGQIIGAWTDGTAPSPVTGSGTGTFSAGVGYHVDWMTNSVVNGRRVRGRTFFVPAVASTFDSSGNVKSASVASVQSACNTLLTNVPTLCVYHKPPKGLGAGGFGATVTSVIASNKTSWLRSRKV